MVVTNTTKEEKNLVPSEDEWPVSTFIAVCFIASYILLIMIVKTIIEWSEFIKVDQNRFDLIIYKPPIEQQAPKPSNANGIQKNQSGSKNSEKRLFDNSAVRQHNLKAFQSAGVPLESLVGNSVFNRAYQAYQTALS